MAAVMRLMFGRLGVANLARQSIVDEQGIDSLEELRVLKDSEVSNICKVVRCPGGMIHAAGGRPAVPDHGEMISLRAENNIKLACFWLRHRIRVVRTTTVAEVTMANIRMVQDLRDNEEKYEALTKPVINDKDWPRTMEAVEEWFRGSYGQTKIPLAYVIRRQAGVPVGPDPAVDYDTPYDEMIARAPHTDAEPGEAGGDPAPTFTVDNMQVFEMIASIARDHDCWTYVKPAQRRRDGRRAFLALWDHYLGPNNVDNMASNAERKLASTTYAGEKKRWNFEKYVKAHMDQHQIIESLVEHGHAGIDARSKTRWLLDGIKSQDLDVVKTQILANPTLRADFTGCVTLYKDFLAQKATSNPMQEVTISGVGTGAEGGQFKKKRVGGQGGQGGQSNQGYNKGGGKKGPLTGVEDRYYKRVEFIALSQPEKDELEEMRSKRPGGSNKKQKTGGGGKKGKDNIASLTRTVASLMSSITDLKDEVKRAENIGADDETTPANNRTNRNTTRQRPE